MTAAASKTAERAVRAEQAPRTPRARTVRLDNGRTRVEVRIGAVWFSLPVEAARDLVRDLAVELAGIK